ncbi:hypothetical protein SKPI104516_18410 [Skermania piniformis]
MAFFVYLCRHRRPPGGRVRRRNARSPDSDDAGLAGWHGSPLQQKRCDRRRRGALRRRDAARCRRRAWLGHGRYRHTGRRRARSTRERLACHRIGARATRRQAGGRLCNLHFYMPPTANGADLMSDGETDPDVLHTLQTVLPEFDIHPFVARRECTGFIFNRVWAAIKRESLAVVAEGVADPSDVDAMWFSTSKGITRNTTRICRPGRASCSAATPTTANSAPRAVRGSTTTAILIAARPIPSNADDITPNSGGPRHRVGDDRARQGSRTTCAVVDSVAAPALCLSLWPDFGRSVQSRPVAGDHGWHVRGSSRHQRPGFRRLRRGARRDPGVRAQWARRARVATNAGCPALRCTRQHHDRGPGSAGSGPGASDDCQGRSGRVVGRHVDGAYVVRRDTRIGSVHGRRRTPRKLGATDLADSAGSVLPALHCFERR